MQPRSTIEKYITNDMLHKTPIKCCVRSYTAYFNKEYFSFVCLHVCAYAFKFKIHRGSAFEPGASGLPYYCTPTVLFSDVIGALAVWRHKNKKNNDAYGGLVLLCLRGGRVF